VDVDVESGAVPDLTKVTPVIFVDISAVRANFCMKFYTVVKHF